MSARACSDISCANLESFGVTDEVCTFQADPDVAGIGVLLSFIIVGVTTFLLSGYIFFYVPHGFSHELLNELDQNCIKFVQEGTKFIRKWIKSLWKWTSSKDPTDEMHEDRRWSSKFRTTLSDIVIMLSDQQLVLGFSILTVGYFKFGSTTQYHFAIISALSNISFVVHISTVPILKAAMFSDTEKVSLKEFKRLWRAVAKICFDILLFVSLWPTGNTWWLKDYGISVSCIWSDSNGNYHGQPLRMMIANMVLLTWGIWYEFNAFFPALSDNGPSRTLLTRWVWVLLLPKRTNEKLERLRRDELSNSPRRVKHHLYLILEHICWIVSVVTLIFTEVIYSQSLRLTRNWAMLISNMHRIFQVRSQATKQGRIGNENAWSFGQGVAMFVLILPLCLAIELYSEHWVKTQPRKPSLSSLISATSSIAAQEACTGAPFAVEPRGPVNARISVTSRTKKHCSWAQDCSRCLEAVKESENQPLKSRNAFYFGYPDPEPNEFDFEREIYGKPWFQWTMVLLQFSIFVAVTYWAVKGWAF